MSQYNLFSSYSPSFRSRKARSNKALLKKYRQITACLGKRKKLILENYPQTSIKEPEKKQIKMNKK